MTYHRLFTAVRYQAWKTSGDLTSLKAAYPECKALVDFMVRHVNPEVGLAEFGYCECASLSICARAVAAAVVVPG